MDVAYNFYVAVQELTEHRRLFNAKLHEMLANQKKNNSTQTREQRDYVLSVLSRFSALGKQDRKEFPPRVYQLVKKYMVADLSAFHPCTNCPCPPWLSLHPNGLSDGTVKLYFRPESDDTPLDRLIPVAAVEEFFDCIYPIHIASGHIKAKTLCNKVQFAHGKSHYA